MFMRFTVLLWVGGLAQQLSDIELNSDGFLHDQNTALSEGLRQCTVLYKTLTSMFLKTKLSWLRSMESAYANLECARSQDEAVRCFAGS